MGSKCSRRVAANMREELWSYLALSGLLFLNVGIVLMVFALKDATRYPTFLEIFGIGLILLGVLTTITSWYGHRQQRQKKRMCVCLVGFCTRHPCCACCDDTGNKTPRGNKVFERESHGVTPLRNGGQKSAPDHTIKMFSTPEFQKYAEFLKRDTVGVDPSGPRKMFKNAKVKPHAQRQLAQVDTPKEVKEHPAAVFTNPRYTRTDHDVPKPVTMASPIFLNLSSKPH